MQAFLRDARDFLPILLQGCVVTVELTLAALIASTLLGFVWALARLSPSRVLSTPAVTIITVIRGIPILVQLFYIYFVLPDLGIQLSAFQAGFIGLGIAYSAYQAANFSAGIEAVDRLGDHGGRADAWRPADRGLDVQEHDGVHAGRAAVSGDEPAADLPRSPAGACI